MLRLEHSLVPVQIAALLIVAVVQVVSNAVSYSNLPRPVRAAIEAKFGDARYVCAERDTAGGQVIHEGTLHRAGRRFDLAVTPDGEVVEVETPLAGQELPPVVTQALAARHPAARVEQVTAYEICLTTEGQPSTAEAATTDALDRSAYPTRGGGSSDGRPGGLERGQGPMGVRSESARFRRG